MKSPGLPLAHLSQSQVLCTLLHSQLLPLESPLDWLALGMYLLILPVSLPAHWVFMRSAAPSNRGNWAWHTHSKPQVESMQLHRWTEGTADALQLPLLVQKLCYLDTARMLCKGREQESTCPPLDWLLTRLTSLILVFSISGLSRLPLLYVDFLPPLIIASAPPSQKDIYKKTWVIFNLFLIEFPPRFFG